jgi:hypothetical protein
MIGFHDFKVAESYQFSDSVKNWRFRGYRTYDGRAVFAWFNFPEGVEEERVLDSEELNWVDVKEWV